MMNHHPNTCSCSCYCCVGVIDQTSKNISSSSSSGGSGKRKAGRKKFKETRHPVYRGVRERNGGKWVCEVRSNNNNRIWLGTYRTPEMAARAHDVAVLALRGPSAPLNFPHSASLLPRPASTSPDDIRAAAAAAAAAAEQQQQHHEINYNYEFMDEEAVFNTPAFLRSMAEGLLLSPPPLTDQDDSPIDLSLWTHSLTHF